MVTLFFGFIGLIAVIGASIAGARWGTYMQLHSLTLVFGGTFAILFFSTSKNVLRSTWRSLVAIVRDEDGFDSYKAELIGLAQNRSKPSSSKNELVQYAADLWSQGIDPELFIVLVSQKKKEIESKMMDAIQALKNLSKYPPALGMTGTVMGMIALFSDLDSNKANIGSNLSLSMTATFFGLILTNVIISPLADRLHVKQMNQSRRDEALYEILLLINRGEPLSLITEELEERSA